jgi:alginate O-acetyltransferase complex protein AlgI
VIFSEPAYFVFLAVTALSFRFLPPRVRPWWLFLTGLVFYAYYSAAFLVLLLVEMVVVYVLAGRARRSTPQFVAGLLITVGVLVAFKYTGMLGSTARTLLATLGAGGLPTFPQLFLPLAISFFTFEFVHYIVEARRGTLPEHSFAEFLAFAVFFPTMVAGPIKRFGDFLPQIRSAHAGSDDVSAGAIRIVVGLFKKIVIADTAGLFVAPLLTDAAMRSAGRVDLLVALLAYSVKIYFDFSGYSDIAIGSARMFGISVPENFAWPYLQTNIRDFWRTWHMSLTSWITDYVYKPLGGSRRGLLVAAAATLTAFAVSGLWHGAAWHFVAWGLYMGVLLVAYRLWATWIKAPMVRRVPSLVEPSPAARALSVAGGLAGALVTFGLVTLGWGLFVMPLSRFTEMLGRFL